MDASIIVYAILVVAGFGIYYKIVRKRVNIKLKKPKILSGKYSETFAVPKEWVPKNQKTSNPKFPSERKLAKVTIHKPRRIQVPGLRFAKRVVAGILFLANGFLFLAIVRWPSPYSDYMALMFFLNAFIILDYLFKTRHKPRMEIET